MGRFVNIFKRGVVVYTMAVLALAGLVAAPTVNAQLVVTDAGLNALETKKTVEEAINKPLGVAIIQILVNLISFVANRLAYDAALAIASGGPGQSSNIEYRSIEEYGEDLFNDVLGETIGSLSQSLNTVGIEFDVCAPADPQVRLNLQLGIAEGANTRGARREPTCNFRDIQSNWEGYLARLEESNDPQQVFKDLAGSFGSGQTDLSATLSIFTQTINQAAETEAINQQELLANDRFKDVSNIITGNVETPSSVLQEQFQNKLNAAQDNQTEALQGALFGNEGALLQIGVSAGSVFLNTLLSQLTNKIYNGLFEPPTTGGVFNPDFIDVGGRSRAQSAFRDLLSAPIQTVDQYNVVNQFVTCPGSQNRGPNNCVIDTGFAAAIARAEAGQPMTVQEAIDEGLLNGDWPLISSERAELNQDPFCYTSGYCHGNLVKLRIARVLPIGWELAADKSGVDGPVKTLQEVINEFNNCNEDNPNDLVNVNNPYCHLIDPNWVLKYPETQCRAQVFGQALLSQNSNQRVETCVDTPSCIEEDANGNCIGGYGYCTRERNVWRFDGDVCPAEYASCTTVTSRTGDRDSVLTNTVDFANCDADNAGCLEHYNTRYLDNNVDTDPADDAFVFATGLCIGGVDSGDACVTDADCEAGTCSQSALNSSATLAPNDFNFLNANAVACDSSQGGCTELVRAAQTTLNILPNASFETDTDQDGVPDGWSLGGNSYEVTGAESLFGADAILVSGSSPVAQNNPVYLAPNQFYTFSYYAKRTSGAGSTTSAQLFFSDAQGAQPTPGSAAMPTLTSSSASNCVAGSGFISVSQPTSEVYERVACSFSTGSEPVWTVAQILAGPGQASLDGVQLEELEVTTPFTVTYSAREEVSLKVPPSYLGCTGDATDPAACADYAKVCVPSEVGCTAYTPDSGNPTIPGIVNQNDYCPSQCVGYDSYRQLATNFSETVFPVNFIPSSAETCTAQQAGCAEFTNLDALNEGGESRAYFSDVRVCQEVAEAAGTNTAQGTFYTWEGSDEEGFQIRTWTLKTSNVSAAPCTNFDAATGNCVDILTTPPAGCSQYSDIVADPDCREFYDTDGNIHYRYYSDTITVDDACSPYRKSVSNQTDCSSSGGVWNTASGNCTYNIMASESVSCNASANGCRGYTGNTGNNTRVLLSEIFESGNVSDWAADANGSAFTPAPIYSNESVAASGHSAELTYNGAPAFMYHTPSIGQFQDGYSYMVSFWAKGSGAVDAYLTDANGEEAILAQGQALSTGWQTFTFGPVEISNASGLEAATTSIAFGNVSPGTSVFIDNVVVREVQDTVYLIENSWVTPSTCDQTPQGATAPGYHLGCEAYTDQNGGRANLKSFTSICREEVIGCEAFYDTKNSTETQAQAFNLTCSLGGPVGGPTACSFNGEEVCTVLTGQASCQFDYTGVSNPDVLQTYVQDDSIIVERDQKIYLVDTPSARCSPDATGCTEYGVPDYDLTGTQIESFETRFLLNRPDDYASILCESEDLFCEAYSTDTGNLLYFKNPGDKMCEYRTGVLIENTQYFGWFREGTSIPCYYDDSAGGTFDPATDLASAYLIGGVESGIWRNGDSTTTVATSYDGWVGLCPSEQNSCSEFVDPADTAAGVYPDGRPYYFLNNEKIAQESASQSEQCDGLVSQENGCVAFNDTSIPYTTFNASATYVASWHAEELLSQSNFSPVAPIDCNAGGGVFDSNGQFNEDYNLCERFCVYPQVVGFAGTDNEYDFAYGGSCLVDADCGTMTDDFGNDQQGTCFALDGTVTAGGVCTGGTGQGDLCDVDADCTGGGTCNPITTADIAAQNGGAAQHLNDSNTVLNVRRDRSCSEWLACDSQYTTFDEASGQYINVCESVSLCNEFTNNTGDGSFCAGWTDSPQEILTEDVYAARDVTWYGSEYSGYSIPDQFGIEHYTQVNVNPAKWCVNVNSEIVGAGTNAVTTYDQATGLWSAGVPIGCATDSACQSALNDGQASCIEADPDFRLAVQLGVCLDGSADGTTCEIGTCSDTGFPCAASDQCGTGATCELAGNTQFGTCYSGLCVDGIDGGTIGGDALMECRGYPENNAPFPNEVVTQWRDLSTVPGGPFAEYLEEPESYRAGFSNVETCAKGEVCECTYTKVEYADGAETLYLEPGASDASQGVCSGGEYDGASCSDDNDCRELDGNGNPTTGGVCQFKTSENDYLGWEGYCLQRDLSINILGNKDKNACLLWLPVDRLRGSTDLYGKQTEAGYQIASAAYCTETEVFADLYPTGWTDSTGAGTLNIACAETYRDIETRPYNPADVGNALLGGPIGLMIAAEGGGASELPGDDYSAGSANSACNEDEWDNCWASVYCPRNSFAVIGACKDSSSSCQQSNGDDDCPYFCVPNGAVAETDTDIFEEGDVCGVPPGYAYQVPINSGFGSDDESPVIYSSSSWTGDVPADPGTPEYEQQYGYLVTDINDFRDDYYACVKRGVPIDPYNNTGDLYDNWYVPVFPLDYPIPNDPYRSLDQVADYYLGCSQIAYTSVEQGYGTDPSESGNAAFTNRVLTPNTSGMSTSETTDDGFYTLTDLPAEDNPLFTSHSTPDEVGQLQVSYEFGDTNDVLQDSSQIDFSPPRLGSCDDGNDLETIAEGDTGCDDNQGLPYDRLDVDYPGGAATGDADEALVTWNGSAANSQGDASVAYNALLQFFAKIYSVWDYEPDLDTPGGGYFGRNQTFDGDASIQDQNDIREDGDSYGLIANGTDGLPAPPTIAAVTTPCVGDNCTEGVEDAVTVNGNIGTTFNAGASFLAQLSFFAWTDPNQYPLRKVLVDWGDGLNTGWAPNSVANPSADAWGRGSVSGSTANDNYYRARRGLDGAGNAICESPTGEEVWGQTTDSCQAEPFRFQHHYRCTPGMFAWLQNSGRTCDYVPGTNILVNSPCTDGVQCIYQPRVHIVDNWGYCTGTCTGVSSDPSCFSEIECDYDARPTTPEADGSYTNPWINWSGTIQVTPE